MALEVFSTTDTKEQVEDSIRQQGYEPEDVVTVTDEPVTEEAAPAPPETPAVEPAVEPEGITAAEPESVGETQEVPGEEELPRGVRKRIDKVVFERQEEIRKNLELEARIKDLESRLAPKPEEPVVEPPAPVKPEPKPEPQFEDFADADNQFTAYTKAYAAWNREQIREETRAEMRQQHEQAQAEQVRKSDAEVWMDTWAMSAEKAKATGQFPDWDEVAKAEHDVSGPLVDAMYDSEQRAVIGYYLKKHPEESKRIAEATAYKPTAAGPEILAKNRLAVREVVRIERLIESGKAFEVVETPEAPAAAAPKPAVAAPPPAARAATATPPKAPPAKQAPKVSGAPAPIVPLAGRSGAPGKDPSKMTAQEYREYGYTEEGAAWRKSHGLTPLAPPR